LCGRVGELLRGQLVETALQLGHGRVVTLERRLGLGPLLAMLLERDLDALSERSRQRIPESDPAGGIVDLARRLQRAELARCVVPAELLQPCESDLLPLRDVRLECDVRLVERCLRGGMLLAGLPSELLGRAQCLLRSVHALQRLFNLLNVLAPLARSAAKTGELPIGRRRVDGVGGHVGSIGKLRGNWERWAAGRPGGEPAARGQVAQTHETFAQCVLFGARPTPCLVHGFHRALRRILPAPSLVAGGVDGASEAGDMAPQVAQLRAGLVRLACLEGADLPVQPRDLALLVRLRPCRFLETLKGGPPCRLSACLRAPARIVVFGRFEQVGRDPVQLAAGVAAVDLLDGRERFRCARQIGHVAAMLLQILQRLGGVLECGLRELRESILEILRQVRIESIPHARVAHDAQQVEVLLEVGAAEEASANLVAVGCALVVAVDYAGLDHRAQPVGRQRNAPLDQVQIDARPARRDEPPRGHALGRAVGADAASEAHVRIAPGQLDPEISLRLWFVAARQHPRAQHPRLLARGVDASRVAVEQERQQHVHGGRLARSVHAAQQQPAAAEVQRLVLVLVDVQDPCTAEPPALGLRCLGSGRRGIGSCRRGYIRGQGVSPRFARQAR